MSKRTVENCVLVKKAIRLEIGEPEIQADGRCLGYAAEKEGDEPCEICKECKLNTSYDA